MSQIYPYCQAFYTCYKIVHEIAGRICSTSTHTPAHNQLRFRVYRNPGPHIAEAELSLFIGGTFLFFA